jgi:hypothetical protein
MYWASMLRQELSARNQEIARLGDSPYEIAGAVPSVIFQRTEDGKHGNFYSAAYRNIRATPQWHRRLAKVYTASRRVSPASQWRWSELDCANSSDALLMNIFCHARSVRSPAICGMLGTSAGLVPEFGFKPRIPFVDGKTDRTEMDMKLGDLLVEAKLTESDFQTAPARLIKRYRDIDEVFDVERLPSSDGVVCNYQLIRGALAAHFTGGSFCVLCDARRPDLIEKWYLVMRAVRGCDLRCRLQLLTWQELSAALPKNLRQFLAGKYGIADKKAGGVLRNFAPHFSGKSYNR